MKFVFIVAATLTDISVQLNKGGEHTAYVTTPNTVQRRGGRAGDHAGGRSTFSGCAVPTFQAHVYIYFIYIIYIYI